MNKYTEIIDKYLGGELNAEDKKAFEKLLETNAELKTELELQKQVLKGIDRAGLKAELKKGFKKGSFRSKSGKWFMGIVIGTIAVSSVWIVKDKILSSAKNNIRYELNEENNKNWNDADKHINPEIFSIQGDKDTVIETKAGIILTIPAKAFVNNTGGDVTENYELEIKEAMNPLDIMKAGLSTTSNGQLLETGGMFYINARQNKTNLTLAHNKGIYASIPDNNPRKKMMLFDGKRMPDGQINWVDPKPFEKKLNAVDILNLNFYPSNFLDSLKNMGFDIKNKKLTDSIYYSFECGGEMSGYETEFDTYREPDSTKTITAEQKNQMEKRAKLVADSIARAITLSMNSTKFKEVAVEPVAVKSDSTKVVYYSSSEFCEIAPSRIHAIWDKKFNNTLLATKEFEERLPAIFKTCNPKILKLYIKNLDKKMYQIDSMAMSMLEGSQEFEKFYLRHDGGISINESHMKKLQAYMEEKQMLYEDAAKTALKKMYEKESEDNKKAFQQRSEQETKDFIRTSQVFKEELETNMKEAYRQLGKEYKPFIPQGNYLNVTLISTGWKNVDAYVLESTINRTTLDYTDKETGKKAVIKYEPLIINVSDKANYDRVVGYLIPDKLSSFQRMRDTITGFKETLNELFSYSAVVFGFKGEEVYCQHITNAKPGEKTISLTKMSKTELDKYRNMNAGAAVDLVSELNYQLFEQKDAIRKKAIAKRENVRQRLWLVVFPCGAVH